MIPHYIEEGLHAYARMSSEDRRMLLSARYFDTDPLTCDTRYLPILGLEAGVSSDELSLAEDESALRSLISEKMRTLRHAGTVSWMRSGMSAVGLEVNPMPWSAYGAQPYRYRLDISTKYREITPSIVDNIERIALQRQSVRDILDGASLAYLCDATASVACGAIGEVYAECEQIYGYTIEAQTMLYGGAGVIGEVYTNIGGDT